MILYVIVYHVIPTLSSSLWWGRWPWRPGAGPAGRQGPPGPAHAAGFPTKILPTENIRGLSFLGCPPHSDDVRPFKLRA